MKKILSLILALTFIFAFIPNVFATDTQDFEISLNKFSGNIPVTQSVANKNNDLAWTIRAVGEENSVVPFSPDNSSTPAIAIPFTCPVAGIYVPVLSYYDKNSGGAIVEAYIVPKAEIADYRALAAFVKNVDSVDRLGKLDIYEAAGLNAATALSKSFAQVELSAGDYYFVMIAIGENEKNNYLATSGANRYISEQWFPKLAFKAVEEMKVNDEITYNLKNSEFKTDLIPSNGRMALGNVKYENMLETVVNKWEIASVNSSGDLRAAALYLGTALSSASTAEAVLALQVPAAGKYSVDITAVGFNADGAMGKGKVKYQVSNQAAFPADSTVETYVEYYNYDLSSTSKSHTDKIATFEAEAAGEYYIRITFDNSEATQEAAKKTLKSEGSLGYYRSDISAIVLTYLGDTDAVATEKAVKAQQQGITGDSAVAEAGTAETTTNTISYLKAFIGGEETNGVLSNKATLNADGTYTITADDAPEGYSFLYWTKGLQNNTDYVTKRIVSVLPEVTFKPEAEANYLIAVYGKTDDAAQDAKYFNANGQLLPDDSIPTMPGYGAFKGWVHCGNNVYMADYEGAVNYTVTVNNDGKNVDELTRDYGTEVKVTAPARASDGYRVFAYWEKDGEIVSFDRSYIFYAFEDCIVNAVYNDYAPLATSLRKIILTNIGNNNYMTEFIGFGNVPEKGIEVDGNRIAMTTNKTQFTIDAEKNTATVKGYVVDTDGKLYYSK